MRDGAWQPVTVGIEPARPVAGTLAVSTRSTSGSETTPIEVAAGSRKLYRFLAPPGVVQVTLTEDGAEPLSMRERGDGPTSNDFLVGLLGDGAANLPPLRSDITGQVGAWVTVDPAWLDISPQAVDPLGTVVASFADLEALAPAARRNLAAAVAAGVDLVVAGGSAEDLSAVGLPWDRPEGAWQLRGEDIPKVAVGAQEVLATAIPAGYGRVVTTDVQPGESGLGRSGELWSALSQPSTRPSGEHGDYRVTTAAHQFTRLLAEEDSDVPALPGLGLFVLVYVLVVGPVNALVLARMGRRELAWATVPLITVIFTGGAFLGATTARPPSGGAARLTYWTDGPATEFIAAGLRAPTPGRQSLALAGVDWTVRPLVDGSRDTVVGRGTDTTVAMDLTAMQLGGVAAWRTTDAPPPLDITATATGDGVEVTVRNVSGRPLTDLVVRTATARRALPQLAAGASSELKLGGADLPEASAYRDPFEELPMDVNGSVTPPLSMRAVLNTEVADGRPGMVWVSAVDETARLGDVAVDGQAVRDRGSMLAVGAQIQATAGAASPFTINRSAYVALGGPMRIGPEAVEGGGEVFLRYRLPPDVDPSTLSNQLGRSNQSDGGSVDVTVWDRRARQWSDPAVAFTAPGDLVSPLGDVWVRASGDMYPFEYSARTIAEGTP